MDRRFPDWILRWRKRNFQWPFEFYSGGRFDLLRVDEMGIGKGNYS